MNIQLSFPATNDWEMRDDTTPVVVAFEAPPRPPHLANYQDFTDSDSGGGYSIDARLFNNLEHHRGQTLWVWRITGGKAPLEPLEGCWAEARIESYREQVMRLEGFLAAERDITKGLEDVIDKAHDLAALIARKRRPSRADATIIGKVLLRAVQHANWGFGLYASLNNHMTERLKRHPRKKRP